MNAELRRYAWLDLGWHRLVLGPLVLAALAAIVLASMPRPAEPLAWGAFWLFVLLTSGWGTIRSLASVTEEVRDRTWDFQRMAAVTPASLAMGKVFGAPLYQWYLGAWCLAVLAVAGLGARLPSVPSMIVGSVAGAVVMQGLGVALSTAGARTRLGERTRRAGGVLLVLGIVQALPLFALFQMKGADFVLWWDWRLPAAPFCAASLVAFAGWSLLAAWRAMLRELQEPARPWPWPAFALFAALWWGGLTLPQMPRAPAGAVVAVAAAVMAFATYGAALVDPLTRVSLARMARAWRRGPARWQPRVPAWALHGVLAVALGAVAFALRGDARHPLATFVFPVALMALRDAAVIACFGLATTGTASPTGRAVFYIALADLLVPAVAAAVQLPGLARAAFPLLSAGDRPWQAAAGMALHALVAVAVLAFLVVRARRRDTSA